MARAANKTVRFTRVVQRSGQPHVHTLWVAPEKDAELKRAREDNRVMVLERTGAAAKTDVGIIGFEPSRDHGAQLLIFPKSLKPFQGARVVGIKFDLLDQPEVVAATDEGDRATRSRRTAHPGAASKAKAKQKSDRTRHPQSGRTGSPSHIPQ